MDKREFFKQRIDKITKESFNNDQKEIAKKIIDNTNENDLDAVWGLISQRVKTGFVFDEAPEVNHNCVAYIKENEKLGINLENKDALEHALIIGENYDALKNLVAMYTDKQGKGLIDVIYIDPPYNTEKSKQEGNDYKEEIEGKNKFIYRDKYTRDGWLNMMNERLKLSRKILSDKGVIFISIDSAEHSYLKVLCDEIFGEENVEDMIWHKVDNDSGKLKVTHRFRIEHEYVIVCYKNKKDVFFNKFLQARNYKNTYTNPDNDPRGPYKQGIISDTEEKSSLSSPNFYSVTTPSGKVYNRRWRVSQEEFNILREDNRIYFGKNGDSVPSLKVFINEKGYATPISILDNLGTAKTAGQELLKIFGDVKVFDYPKPKELLKHLIHISSNKNIVVLDFFAGSGTTGQAVMELNEEDGGNRKFILVTNNENNIAKNITRERLYRVIKGQGSKGEDFDWAYSKDKKNLENNSVRVFDIVKEELNITEVEKAEKIKEQVEKNFAKLKPDYLKNNNLDIYNVLASLTPYKDDSEE